MRISFYAPFKPLDHPHPSGDRVIGAGLVAFLKAQGHNLRIVSRLRTRWLYLHPWHWPAASAAAAAAFKQCRKFRPHLWLTYHTYYKAPDLLGPWICKGLGIPYVIFQGIYATKRRKRFNTWPGFVLNREALTAAHHVFTNRRLDFENLARIIPGDRLSYVAPGIFPAEFERQPAARERLRREWGAGDLPVVLTAAMFRPDVKTRGLVWVIRSCGRLWRKGLRFLLVIAGDGVERPRLEALAREEGGDRIRFLGKVPRSRMAGVYSASDVFVFPGIRESLGMVFLESQSCGLPVVAFDNGGIPEVVRRDRTGILTPPFAEETFDRAVETVIMDQELRTRMGDAARIHVGKNHDLNQNYREVLHVLERIIQQTGERPGYRR